MITFLTALMVVGTPTVIENVRIEVGDGHVIQHGAILFDGGRIKAVGKVVAPNGAKRIDGTGKTLTPGLIETRSHIGLVELSLIESTVDFRSPASLAPGFRAADGFNPTSVLIPIARAQGITSAITYPRGGIIAGTGSWVDLTGRTDARPDPAQPLAMFGTIGRGALHHAGGSRGGIWRRIRRLVDDVRFFDKNRSALDRGDSRQLVLPPNELSAMLPVLKGKLPLVLEMNRSSDILTAIEWARSNGVRLVITGGQEAWRVADALAKANVPVILSPSDQSPQSFDALAARDDAATLLEAAGVPLIISSGGWSHNARRLRQEAGIAVAYGLKHETAIRAITERPAQVFGKASEVGTITKGKRANLVLWSGDPLEVMTLPEAIWIDGLPQSLDNRQHQLARRYMRAKR